jgi:hypothetical protein
MQGYPDVVYDGQGFEKTDVLEGPGYAVPRDLVGSFSQGVLPRQGYASHGGLINVGEQVEHGGLARSVGSDEPHNLARLHLDVEIVKRLKPAEFYA